MVSAAQDYNSINKRLYNPQKEREILGHLLNKPEEQTDILLELKSEHFSDQSCQAVYELMIAMFREQRDISLIGLRDYMEIKCKSLTNHNILGQLVEDISGLSCSDTVLNTVQLLKDLEKNRKIYHEVLIKGDMMFRQGEPTEVIIKHMVNMLSGVETGTKEKSISAVVNNVVDDILNPKESGRGLQTGLVEFDVQFGGIKRDRYYTIGAAPGIGKTAMVINLIHNLVSRHGSKIAILFFSLEMSEDRVVRRLISRITKLNNEKLESRLKALTSEQKEQVKLAKQLIETYPVEVVYQTMTVSSLEMRMKKFSIENPDAHKIAILDHIGLVKGATDDIRKNTIQASQTMKGFCRDYDATSIVLTQLKKELMSPMYKKSYHRPDTSFIMESGQIHQDSDGIILLWRPEMQFETIAYGHDEEWSTKGKLIGLNEKNRDGQPFTDLIWDCNIGCNIIENTGAIFN